MLSAEPGVAAMLLDAAAPINALNKAGVSPLATACRAANWPLAKFLLEHGAKPAPAEGEPALVAAAGIADDDVEGSSCCSSTARAVNARRCAPPARLLAPPPKATSRSPAHCAPPAPTSKLADRHGSTALMEAARAGACGIVQLLAEAQADARVRDQPRPRRADAGLPVAARPRRNRARVAGAGRRTKDPGSDGRSALDHAAAAGRWDLVALLDPDTPLPTSLSQDLLAEGADTPAHLLDALRFGHWAIVSGFAERVREWPQPQLAQLYLDLATPGLAAARRWLLEHGLDAEARLDVPRIDDAETADRPALPPLGRRLFDALLQQLPDSTEALDDLLQGRRQPGRRRPAGAGAGAA